ncbi:Hypothetical predicted protein, partial [Olea europaea subsp. europaea]
MGGMGILGTWLWYLVGRLGCGDRVGLDCSDGLGNVGFSNIDLGLQYYGRRRKNESENIDLGAEPTRPEAEGIRSGKPEDRILGAKEENNASFYSHEEKFSFRERGRPYGKFGDYPAE